MSALFRLLVPAFVFQAVVVGAGYATGRELVEFFMGADTATGLAGLAVAAVTFSLVMAIALENARTMEFVDYRSFLRAMIGRFWIGYEFCYGSLLIIVLAVLASAAGEIANSQLGLPPLIGSIATMGLVCVVVFFGTGLVERFLVVWSILLYVLFALVLAFTLWRYGGRIGSELAAAPPHLSAIWQGVLYAGYNVAVVPAILYAGRRLRSRNEAIVAGLIAGPVAILPGMLFFLAMSAFLPGVRDAPVPIDFVLQRLDQPWLSTLFYIALFGIFVKTGAALIHAVNERIESAMVERGRSLSARGRSGVALAMILFATVVGERVGIVDLIGSAYRVLTVGFLLVFVGPLLVIGGSRMWRRRAEQ